MTNVTSLSLSASQKKLAKQEVTALRIKAELRQVSLIIGFRSRKVAQVDVAGELKCIEVIGIFLSVTLFGK